MADKPPLPVWLCLALALFAVMGWIFFQEKKIARTGSEAITETLLKRSAHAGTKPVVLVIGTSLVQSGLDSTDRICRCVEANTGTKIILLKCWMSGGDLARISQNQGTVFRGLRPAVVLIETNLLFYRPARTPLLSRFAQTFRDLIGGRRNPGYDPDERAEILPSDRSAIESARSGLVDSTDLAGFRDICTAWQHTGTRIGLVNIPLEKILENKKWHSADTANFAANLRFLQKTGPVSVNESGLQLDSTYFFDFGHLNRKGNTLFAPWFCRLLSAEVSLSAGKKEAGQ